MASLTPSYGGMSYDRIDEVGLQWPCPTPDHPGTEYLHEGRFTRGKGLLHVIDFRPPAEVPDDEYPLVLSTGRTLYHYNIGNMTQKVGAIRQKQPENFVEIHRAGRRAAGGHRWRAGAGDHPARVESTVRARVGQRTRPGAVWMPFHFVESPPTS